LYMLDEFYVAHEPNLGLQMIKWYIASCLEMAADFCIPHGVSNIISM